MKSLVIIGILIALVIGGYMVWNQTSKSANQNSSMDSVLAQPTQGDSVSESTDSGTPIARGMTISDIATHADESSCWTVIRGNVYDVTSFISMHEGGSDKILDICGKDGTDEFVSEHGGKQEQEMLLNNYKIGVVAE